jgi:hypothetical protein
MIASDWENAFCFFANCHKMEVLRKDTTFGASNALRWALELSLDAFILDFRICTRTAPSKPEFARSLTRIIGARGKLDKPIGDFFWNRLIAAVDRALANQLIDSPLFATGEQIYGQLAAAKEFEDLSDIKLPVYTQSMTVLVEYEMIIVSGIPFEERFDAVTPGFLAALVVYGKKRDIIPLGVDDMRLWTWLMKLGIDLRVAHNKLVPVEESRTVVPFDLWS